MNKIVNWKKEENQFIADTKNGVLGISFAQNDILRIRFNTGSKLKEEETFVVLDAPDLQDFEVITGNNELILDNGFMKVYLDTNTFAIKAYNCDDVLVLSTPAYRTMELKNDQSIFRFKLDSTEKIYGLGQDPRAKLDHRDQERRMWQEWDGFRRSGNAGIPFFISNRGYGVLLNSSWASRFAIGRAEIDKKSLAYMAAPAPWLWEAPSEETHPDQMAILLEHGIMDLFIICRDCIDEIQKGYAALTGYAPMPPKWALGFIQCKNRYRSQEELLSIAREYRRRQIPCDVFVIDWFWFKEYGDLEWVKENWPDPEGMLKELMQLGFHVMQAQHPYIDKKALKYEQFKEKGYLNQIPNDSRPTFDHSNPEAQAAWWDEIRRFFEAGIRGYWTDMGELEVHPEGTISYLGQRERVHNIYSLLWTKGLYEGQRRDFGERVFSLARTAYAGIQRNGVAMWSGDIDASWEVFREQVIIGQGVCLSGQQYWTSDVGGFFTDERFNTELYIRWFQWGVFCPVFRTHGTRSENEAWSFGEQAEAIINEFIKLRYKLLPYIYSCAKKVTESGKPIMRAMCVDFSDDAVAVEQETQFMFGPAILVAPIIEEGVRERKVYLPKGTWYDFWDNTKYNGKRWLKTSAPLNRIPLFVRAGSIIPMGPVQQFVYEKPLTEVEIHAYAGCSEIFELYEDDGVTYEYENGKYVKTLITLDNEDNIKVGESQGGTGLIPKDRKYSLVLHKEEKIMTAEELPVSIKVDHTLYADGKCIINAYINNLCKEDSKLKAILKLPNGWSSLQKSPSTFEQRITRELHLQWEAHPIGAALPLVNEGSIEFIITSAKKSYTVFQSVSWGTGYATRWNLIGNFEGSAEKGIEQLIKVEIEPDLPCYEDGINLLQWRRMTELEFNCLGYVDFRLPQKHNLFNGKGISYAKCKIWVKQETECFLEIMAEPCIMLWINRELVFRSDSIHLKKILKDKPVLLKKGWNDCLIKSAIFLEGIYTGREHGFSFRALNSNGEILKELLYMP